MTQPLNHVLEHVRANLAHDLRQSELAELSGYTPSGFSRAFFRETGMRFSDYLTGLRINQACTLLTESERAITDICYDVGFNNVSNFNRRFIALTRMTPSAYRRRRRENEHPPSFGGRSQGGHVSANPA